MKNKIARREFIKGSSSTTLGIGMKPNNPDGGLWTENILHIREEVDFWLVDKTFPFAKCNSELG